MQQWDLWIIILTLFFNIQCERESVLGEWFPDRVSTGELVATWSSLGAKALAVYAEEESFRDLFYLK